MNDDLIKLQKKLEKAEKKIEIYEQSPAMILTKTLKRECLIKNIIIIMLIVALISSFCYITYLLNDFEYTETTTSEVVDMDSQEGNNNYVNGDNSGTITNN